MRIAVGRGLFPVLVLAAFAGMPYIMQATPLRAQSAESDYRPDLGDLMSTTQWRHLKLAYAGELLNWNLAGYEVGQIRKSFETAAKLYPTLGDVQLAALVRQVSEPALNDVDKAIEMKDSHGFAMAFSHLTEACNSCHKASGYGFVDIRVPTSSPFSNQSFVAR